MRHIAAVLLLTFVLAGPALGAVSASFVTSSGQLLSGTEAEGRVGDLILANDEIILVISAIGHVTRNGENGGTIIDAGTSAQRADALGELYTYFDDDWPRQAVYQSLQIVNDGSNGNPAIIRASGYDLNNPSQLVVTEYSLGEADRHVTLTTWVTGSGATRASFELGDAFHWGACRNFAPAAGFDLGGVTTQPWIAGLAADVCYAYAGIYGDNWGPNGSYWSDVNVTTESISSGEVVSYTRFMAVAPADMAAAVAILYDALGLATGSVTSAISSLADGAALPDAVIDVYDNSGNVLLQMAADGAGQAAASLTPGTWRLQASAPGYTSAERWLTVADGGNHVLDFVLDGGGTDGAAVGDTLTVIQRPLVNIPAFVLPGQTLEINCVADPATTGWQAEITFGAATLSLPVVSASYDASTEWWTLNSTVPAVSLHGLYDLRVTANGGLDDTTRNAVQVLEQFREDYYFIHITDTHLPDHKFSDSGATPSDSTETLDLRAVIQDINLINPEFVLITGDFVNEGELEEYLNWRCYTRAQRQLYEFETPTFLVSGNHDLGGWTGTLPSAGTARRDWWRFFGWPRLENPPPGAPLHTQNYSFDYGPVHFVGMEAYVNYDLWRVDIYGSDSFPLAQMAWLNQDLAAASNSQAQVLFYHYDFQNQVSLSSLAVEMALSGHIHKDQGDELVQPYDLSTNNVCDGERSYRLIRVSGSTLQPETTLSAGAAGENLSVTYAPANAGISNSVTAEITNTQPQRFENGRLRFVMPAAGAAYAVTGGQLVQVEQGGEFDICHVEVDILAAGIQSVTISLDVVGVPDAGQGLIPRLAPNYPNPFNPMTELKFSLPQAGPVSLSIYDLQGHEVAVLVDEFLASGDHTIQWNGQDGQARDMSSGIYLVRLVAAGQETSRKITLAR